MEDLTGRLPEQLSPSRASDFVQCPRLFYYKTIEKLSSPATVATTKGTLAHYAAEKIFDHPREDRTPEVAVPYVRQHWAKLRGEASYEVIVDLGEADVEKMLLEAEQLVRNWFSVERPGNFDPSGRELWVHGEIGGCKMRGVIDRVDEVVNSEGKTKVYVSDYKTGKLPKPQYAKDSFFAMNIYAELLEQEKGLTAEQLRLVYVKNGNRDDVKRQEVTTESRAKTVEVVAGLWGDITSAAQAGEFAPRTSVLCGWCHFQDICPAFANEKRIF